MFRIICAIIILGLGYLAYDAYGYRYVVKNFVNDADQSMTMGAADPNINIIAYVDYSNSASRHLYPTLINLIASDPNIRLIIRPIETDNDVSKLTTRVALAAKEQGKFMNVNNLFLTSTVNIDNRYVERSVRSMGLNYNLLKTSATSPDVEKQVSDLQAEAAWLNIHSYPYFFIEHVKMSGGVYTKAEIQRVIENIRSGRR